MTNTDRPDNVIHLSHLASRNPSGDDTRIAVRQILKAIDHPDWQQSVPAQAATILSAQSFMRVFDKPMRDAIVGRLSESLNIPLTRIEMILQLNNEPDIRKALRWRSRPFAPEPGEEGYPDPEEGWLGLYLLYARECRANLGWQFWSGVSVLGAACRRNFFLDVGGTSFLYPNHYLLLEGPSGTGKTTAVDRAVSVLEEANDLLEARLGVRDTTPIVHMIAERVTPSALFKELECLATQHTAESGFRLGEVNPKDFETCALLPASEMTTLLGSATYNPQELIGLLTALFDGKINDSTVGRGIAKKLRNVTFSCLFGSTLAWLRHSIDRAAFGGGFMGSRMLIISRSQVNRMYPTAPPIDPILRSHLATKLVELMCHPRCEMELQPDANRLYEAWFNASPNMIGEDPTVPYFTRRNIHLKKLMIVLAVSKGTQPWITRATVEQAIHLLEREEKSMLPAMRAIAGHAALEEMEWVESLFARHAGVMTRRELTRSCAYRLGTLRHIDEVIDVLKAMEAISQRGERSRGNTVYTWNKPTGSLPKLVKEFALADDAGEDPSTS